jgi:hypothetical protein
MRPGARTHLFVLLAFALVLTLVLAPVASAKLIVGNEQDNKLVGTQAGRRPRPRRHGRAHRLRRLGSASASGHPHRALSLTAA